MLEIETYTKKFFENDMERSPGIKPQNHDGRSCWLCERDFISKKRCSNSEKMGTHTKFAGKKFVKDHCHLTGKIRGLAHRECNLLTRKAHSRFVPMLFHNSCV